MNGKNFILWLVIAFLGAAAFGALEPSPAFAQGTGTQASPTQQGAVDLESFRREYISPSSLRNFLAPLKYIFEGLAVIVDKGMPIVSDAALSLLGLGFVIWMAFHLMRGLSSFSPKALNGFLYKELPGGLFKAAIAAAFLLPPGGTTAANKLFDIFIVPVVEGTADVARTITEKGPQVQSRSTRTLTKEDLRLDVEAKVSSESVKRTVGAVKNAVGDALAAVSVDILQLMADGQMVLNYSYANGSLFKFFPEVETFIIGMLMWVMSIMLLVIFPLKFVDALVRILIVMILMPIFVVLWVFPSTRNYVKKGWDVVMYGLILLLTLGFIVKFNVELFKVVMGYDSNIKTQDDLVKAVKVGSAFIRVFCMLAGAYMAYKLFDIPTEVARNLAYQDFAPPMRSATPWRTEGGDAVGRAGAATISSGLGLGKEAGGLALRQVKKKTGDAMKGAMNFAKRSFGK